MDRPQSSKLPIEASATIKVVAKSPSKKVGSVNGSHNVLSDSNDCSSKSTTISTIGVQSGDTRIVIALLVVS